MSKLSHHLKEMSDLSDHLKEKAIFSKEKSFMFA